MFLETEKYLTQKKWIGIHEPFKTIYVNRFNYTDEIYIEEIDKVFIVSFPMKDCTFNYRTTFSDKKSAKTYLQNIVYDCF